MSLLRSIATGTLFFVLVCTVAYFAPSAWSGIRHQRQLVRLQQPLLLPDNLTVGFTTDGAPYLGNLDVAPVTMELFCDLQCPYCRRLFAVVVSRLLSAELQTNMASLVFYDFPLRFHAAAMPAAIAARCVGNINGAKAYWQMQFAIYSRANLYKVKEYKKLFVSYANDVLKEKDMEKYVKCYDNKTPQKKIYGDIKKGLNRNVSGTPWLFINGQLSQARTYEQAQVEIAYYIGLADRTLS